MVKLVGEKNTLFRKEIADRKGTEGKYLAFPEKEILPFRISFIPQVPTSLEGGIHTHEKLGDNP